MDPLTAEQVFRELRRERDRLVDDAHRDLDGAIENLQRLREHLGLATNGQPYDHFGGSTSLFPAPIPDLRRVAAAFDAIERVATLDLNNRQ